MDVNNAKSSVKYRSINSADQIDGSEISDVKHMKRSNKGCIIVCLVAMVVALLIAVVVLASVLGVEITRRKAAPGTPGSGEQEMCLTSACIQASARIKAALNESVDPCEDFYQFSCGSWINDNIIPPGDGAYTLLENTLKDKNNVVLRKILEEEDDGGVAAVRKTIDFYKSCIDTTTIDSRGAEPLQNLISSLGGWNFTERDTTWTVNSSQLVQQKLNGSDAFFSVGVLIDSKNSSVNVLQLSQSGLTVPLATAYKDPNVTTVIKVLIKAILKLIQPDISEEDSDYVASGIVNVEIQLSSIFASQLELLDVAGTYNRFTVGELHQLWPDFDWLTYFREVATFAGIDRIDASEPIIVQSPSYFRNLSKVLHSSNISQTDLQNYAQLRFVYPLLKYLSKEFRTLLGISDSDRTSLCIQYTQEALPLGLARPFVERLQSKNIRGSVSEFAVYIKDAFKEQLEINDWLDDFSRQACKDKVDAVDDLVAYPDEIFNNSYLNDLYANYNITTNNFFDNEYHVIGTSFQTNLNELRKPVLRTRWTLSQLTYPTVVNAAYFLAQNQFIFNAGILQSPVFGADWPNQLNFGGFGSIVGHELTHGFDNRGQMFDKNGNLRQWWTNQSIQEFQQRQQCFVDQYSNYNILGSQVNGQLTLGENIADNGGLRTAFKAYQNTKTSGATPQRLPSLPYTDDQLFFISYGQVWCSLYTPAYIQTWTTTNVHSPSPTRVLGTLQNSEDFAKVFNCPKGSTMNPQAHKKCVLW